MFKTEHEDIYWLSKQQAKKFNIQSRLSGVILIDILENKTKELSNKARKD